jgi:hypothetical protein
MSPEEFAEYRFIIQNALDSVKFSDRITIINTGEAIYIASPRDPDISVLITPRGPELYVIYFDCGVLPGTNIVHLAVPDSVQALGGLISNHLRAKYGRSQSKADIGQSV